MYGPVDIDISKYKEIEHKMKSDINNWLCNLYIDIKRLNIMDCEIRKDTFGYRVPKNILQEQEEA
jgi:hypothetical protein